MLVRRQSLPRSLFTLLAVFMVLTFTQFGPRVTPASAMPMPKCWAGVEWQEVEEPGADGATVVFVCMCTRNSSGQVLYCEWVFSKLKPAQNDVPPNEARRLSSDPPYRMRIETAFGEGVGGGDAIGSIDMRNPDWSDLTRRVAVRTIMQYSPIGSQTWSTCHDTKWKEAPTQRPRWSVWVVQYTMPDCGAGYYRAQSAGRFFSVSLNQWITSNWHYSGYLYIDNIPPNFVTADPTESPVTTTPAVADPNDP